MYASYKDHPEVAVYLVYEQECYPRSPLPNRPEGIAAHTSLERRAEAAATCRADLRLTLPVLLDTMNADAAAAYNCRRSATVVIDRAGNVSFHDSGAYGIQPANAAQVIQKLLRSPAGGDRMR